MKKFLIKFSNCEIIQADKLLHFSFEFLLTALFAVLLNIIGIVRFRITALIVFVVVLGFLKEAFDKYYKPNGKWDWFDIYYGIAGGLLFVLVNEYL